jgi:hypothetical protein
MGGETTQPGDRAAAVHAFFVSMLALLPNTNIGYGAGVMGIVSRAATFRHRRQAAWQRDRLRVALLAVLTYASRLGVGPILIAQPHDRVWGTDLAYITIAFGDAPGRAWALMRGEQLDGPPAAAGGRHGMNASGRNGHPPHDL